MVYGARQLLILNCNVVYLGKYRLKLRLNRGDFRLVIISIRIFRNGIQQIDAAWTQTALCILECRRTQKLRILHGAGKAIIHDDVVRSVFGRC